MGTGETKYFLPWEETEAVQRNLLEWLNSYPGLPAKISYENLPADAAGLCVATIQSAHKLKQYIVGGYLAQYQFNLIYRLQPSTDDDQLLAVELLNRIGAWAEQTEPKPVISDAAVVLSISRETNAALQAVYEDGTKDYQISMNMKWEVV